MLGHERVNILVLFALPSTRTEAHSERDLGVVRLQALRERGDVGPVRLRRISSLRGRAGGATRAHLAAVPDVDDRGHAARVVRGERAQRARLKVHVGRVVLVRDRPGVARAPRVAGVGRGCGVVRAAVFVREGLDTCKGRVGVWSRRGCE